jgi:hypothetical protein
MDDILEQFKKLGSEPLSDEKSYVDLHLRLDKPRVEYIINGYPEKTQTDPKIFAKKLNILHGVESNFSYSMYGDIEYPDEFKSKRCELIVNPSGCSDYIEYAAKGYVGDGLYENDRFFFRFYISPQMARDIIDRRLLAESIADDFSLDDDNNWVWEKLRIDIVDFRAEKSKQRVLFNIIRVYC